MSRSYVVTGGGRGIGRALVEQLLKDADDNAVVAIELDPAARTRFDYHGALRGIPRPAGWGVPRRWRPPSRTCSQKTRAS